MFLVLAAVAAVIVALGHPTGSVIAEHRRQQKKRENLPLNLIVLAVSLGFGIVALAAIPGLVTAILRVLSFDPMSGQRLEFVMAPWAVDVFWAGLLLGAAIVAGGVLSALAARSTTDPQRQVRAV